jgi:DnaJ-domain-containing protein 1
VVEELRRMFEQTGQLPDEAQRQIAAVIAEELEEREWDDLVGTPESQRFLAQLAADVADAEAKGEVEDGGWDR